MGRTRVLLERCLPAVAVGSLLPATISCTLGWYVAETALSYVALFGLLELVEPATALGLAFCFLLLVAASVGFSAIGRTVLPADRERLLLAPMSDRQTYLLAFFGNHALDLFERLLLLPAVFGIAASVVLGRAVALPALWGALVLVATMGCALSLVVNRLTGASWVRRVRRGAGAGTVASYLLLSAATFGVGAFLSAALAPWLSKTPIGPAELDRGRVFGWISSLPAHVADAAAPFEPVVGHPASPVGALARAAVDGSASGFAIGAAWTVVAVTAAAVSCSTGGTWYRTGWSGERREQNGGDLFGLAEAVYLGLARVLFRDDVLVGVQLRNLCRQRRRDASGPMSLFGGPLVWGWAGLAWGAAPFLRDRVEVATIFVFVAGGWISLEHLKVSFAKYQGSLALEAEGRQVALYRAAGRGMFDLHRAKLRVSRLVGGVPLFAALALVALLADLPLSLCALLAAVGGTWFVAWPYVELLPGLLNPHFEWEHPDDLGSNFGQEGLHGVIEGAVVGALSTVFLALVALLLGGWIPPDGYAWMASGVLVLTLAATEVSLGALSRRAARLADRTDLPAR